MMKTKKKSNFNMKTTSDQQKLKKKKVTVKKKKRKNNKNIAQDYIIVDGNIYIADTKTQRCQFSQFIKYMKYTSDLNGKYDKNKISKEQQVRGNGYWFQNLKQNKEQIDLEQKNNHKQIDLEECVNRLSQQQKIQMLRKLQKQVQKQPNSKLQKLQQKLRILKHQLIQKWEIHTYKINSQYEKKQIQRQTHKQKLFLLNKIKDQKLKIIQCTRSLFHNIFGSDQLFTKNNGIQQILKKLNTLSSFEQFTIDGESGRYSESHTNSIKSQLQFQKISEQIQKKQQSTGEEQVSGFRVVSQQSLLLGSDSPQKNDIFQCDEGSLSKKIKIPLLMTKEKIQQIETDKRTKQTNKIKEDIEKRISFQMSQMEQGEGFFTTLSGINNYIMQLYEYIIHVDLQKVVEKLNFPFGKSIRDKISSLQQNGQIDEFQLYPVLEEYLYNQFNKQIMLKMKKLSQYQKIHNKAIFECFNTNLNTYRPYFELEGEVYPWSVSEKGITFYEINEQNIQQVFQKTKIKVLQFASSLCGLITQGCKHDEIGQILRDKRQQLQLKEQKVNLVQQYGKWDIKMINTQALIRILISNQIFQAEMFQFLSQLKLY